MVAAIATMSLMWVWALVAVGQRVAHQAAVGQDLIEDLEALVLAVVAVSIYVVDVLVSFPVYHPASYHDNVNMDHSLPYHCQVPFVVAVAAD